MHENEISNLQKILVIDSDQKFGSFIKKEIKALGYSILVVGTGQEGIQIAETMIPEVIFVDYELPDIKGIEIIKSLKNYRLTRNTAMILLTEKNKKSVYNELIDAGADGMMNKKDDLEILSLHIKEILRRHNLLEELLLSKKKSEKNLKISKQREKEVSRFSQIVAHDLKNPLSVIHSACTLLEDEEMSDEVRALIDTVEKSTARSFEIINGIYALSGLTENAPKSDFYSLEGIMEKV